jgi:glycosyltransferase XagB
MKVLRKIIGSDKVSQNNRKKSNAKSNFLSFRGKKYYHFSKLKEDEMAFKRFDAFQILFLLTSTIVILISITLQTKLFFIAVIAVLSILYFIDLQFYILLIYKSLFKQPEIRISKKELKGVSDKDLPKYSVLCPLYKEKEILPQFIEAMENMDYPQKKLQVLLLLEENDKETIDAARNMGLSKKFEIIVVPHSVPKTKPKALNYGMDFVKGEYVVIFDAEDIPDRDQIKKAVLAFFKSSSKVVCIQAKLNFYNSKQNLLTRLFTLEYSLWFDLVLSGLYSIKGTIPLGGTSNHFKTSEINRLGRWDPFNVTEDADLGIRIAQKGYKTAVMNSYTFEEANSDLNNWFKQRSRWIKGYIQTYFVHMRKPWKFFKNATFIEFLTFQLILGGKTLSLFANPLMWLTTLAYFIFNQQVGPAIQSVFPPVIFYIAFFSALVGNFIYVYYYMIGAAKRNAWNLVPYAILVPFYWLAMSISAFFALWEFIFRLHYWQKTKHGLHLEKQKIDLPKPALDYAYVQENS